MKAEDLVIHHLKDTVGLAEADRLVSALKREVGADSEGDAPLRVGDALHGFCGGTFGRDHYDCCHVEALGEDWVVVRDENGSVDFASGADRLKGIGEYRRQSEYCHEDPCSVSSRS